MQLALAGLLSLSTSVITAAHADTYPTRPIKLVVPYPAGGTNDIVARVLAEQLTRDLRQSVIVENRAGAGGVIGAAYVAGAAPDGYTLLVSAAGPVAVGLSVYDNVPYDARRQFAPIAMLAAVDAVVVTSTAFNDTRSIPEFLAKVQRQKRSVNFSLSSLGAMHHLLTESLILREKLDATRVPYNGATPAIADLIGGQTDILMENLPALRAHIEAGKLHPIALTSARRSPLLPNVPTVSEQGYPELTAAPWFALLAPAEVPTDIQRKLNEATQRAFTSEAVKTALAGQGAYSITGSLDAAKTFLDGEIKRWDGIATLAGLKKPRANVALK